MTLSHIPWPSIGGLHNLVARCDAYETYHEEEGLPPYVRPRLTYRGKIKLHGNNAAVQVDGDEFLAQSRTDVLVPGSDLKQFGVWVHANSDYFREVGRISGRHTILCGEWCGQGIQKGMAIQQTGRKVFCVFAIQYGNGDEPLIEVDPARIRGVLPPHPDIFVLPWAGPEIVIDYADRDQMTFGVEAVNKMVTDADGRDPWVFETFGVEGRGEGYVFYPVTAEALTGPVPMEPLMDMVFKAKGQAHKVKEQKSPAQIDPEVVESIEDFVSMFVTEARLEQGVSESGGEVDMPLISGFLRWMADDVQKESGPELRAADLEWKQVSKAVTKTARDWYITKARG